MGDSNKKDSYSAPFAFVYTFNLIVGIGALALPKAFNSSGLLLGIILLFILCSVSYVTSTFVIEAMAAANAYQKKLKKETGEPNKADEAMEGSSEPPKEVGKRNKPSINASYIHNDLTGSNSRDTTPLLNNGEVARSEQANDYETDDYEINEKYEMGSMADLFFPTIGVVLYYICVCLYLFGDLAIYAVSAPISLTKIVCDLSNYSNFEEMGEVDLCESETDIDEMCVGGLNKTEMYYIFLAVFYILVGPFCFLNMTKTKFLQIVTTIMRHLAFVFMIILAIIHIAEGNGNPHVTTANYKSLPSLFGISVYSFMCQHSLPGMVTPMRSKKWVFWMLGGDFLMTLSFYLLLVITGSFAFEACNMRELYTLDFFKPGEIVKVIIGVYLALFPVFTLSTNFPIIAVTLRENLKALFRLILKLMKIDYTLPRPVEFLLFPTIALVPAIIISYATQQDDILVSITGSFPGVGVQYIIPAALVLMGRYSMKQKFGSYDNKYKSPFSHVAIVCIVFGWTFVSVILIIINLSLNPPKVNEHPIG